MPCPASSWRMERDCCHALAWGSRTLFLAWGSRTLFVLASPPKRIQAVEDSHGKLPGEEDKELPFGARWDRV